MADTTTTTTVPRTPAARATCAAAAARIAARPGLPLAIAAWLADAFDPAAAAYDAARTANDAAALALTRATSDKHAADALFHDAFTRWIQSAVYTSGDAAAVHRDVRPLLGHDAPAYFLKRGARVRLERMARLDLHVREQPHLTGDLARLDALREASAALEATVDDWEAARAEQAKTAREVAPAAATFDRAWGSLVRTVRQLDPGAAALLPTFHRLRKPATAPAPVCLPAAEPEAPVMPVLAVVEPDEDEAAAAA
jgi:hypothetical protein